MIKTKSVYSAKEPKKDGLRILATRIRGRGLPKSEMVARLKPWAKEQKLFSVNHSKDGFAIALTVKAGVEKEEVVRSLVSQLKDIYEVLKALPQSTEVGSDPLDSDVEAPDQ